MALKNNKDILNTEETTERLERRNFKPIYIRDSTGRLVQQMAKGIEVGSGKEKILVYTSSGRKTWTNPQVYIRQGKDDLEFPQKDVYPTKIKSQTPPPTPPLETEKQRTSKKTLGELLDKTREEVLKIVTGGDEKLVRRIMGENGICIATKEQLLRAGYQPHQRMKNTLVRGYSLGGEIFTVCFTERKMDGKYELSDVKNRTKQNKRKQEKEEKTIITRILSQKE